MRNIAIIGAGGAGSLIGGHLTNAGHAVKIIDLWPPHIEYCKSNDLHVKTSNADFKTKVEIFHIHEVAGMHEQFDIVISAVNGYEAVWAMTLMKPLLKPQGWVLPFHDGMMEEYMAEVVGKERVLGVVIDRFGAILTEPGHVVRYPSADHPTTFIIGELDGKSTARLDESVQLLNVAAGTVATDDIWGFHWSKLPRDCTRSPIATLYGPAAVSDADAPIIRRASIGIIAEAVRIGVALGNEIKAETLLGIPAEMWLKSGDATVFQEIEQRFIAAWASIAMPPGPSGMSLQMAKRRRTEIDYLNGYIVAKGRDTKIPTPLNAALTDAIHAMEGGRLEPGIENINRILSHAKS